MTGAIDFGLEEEHSGATHHFVGDIRSWWGLQNDYLLLSRDEPISRPGKGNQQIAGASSWSTDNVDRRVKRFTQVQHSSCL